MKLAIISDIHGNLEALTAVLADIRSAYFDEVLCLGDVVGYGADPNKCSEIIESLCPTTILGNHDAAVLGQLNTQNFNIHARVAIEWTTENLLPETRSFLLKLPIKHEKPDITFIHATPFEPNMWYYITSLEEAAFNFQFFKNRFCFIGHTHIPLIIVQQDEKEVFVHQEDSIDTKQLTNSRFLINVGSVGQPRDRNPQACYGIFDTETQVFQFRRVTYDIPAAQEKMRKIQMPDFLIHRLNEGR